MFDRSFGVILIFRDIVIVPPSIKQYQHLFQKLIEMVVKTPCTSVQ